MKADKKDLIKALETFGKIKNYTHVIVKLNVEKEYMTLSYENRFMKVVKRLFVKETEEDIVGKSFYMTFLEIPKILKALKFYNYDVEFCFKEHELVLKDGKHLFSVCLSDDNDDGKNKLTKEHEEKSSTVIITKPIEFVKILSDQLKFTVTTGKGNVNYATIQFQNGYVKSTNGYIAMRTKVSLFIDDMVNSFVEMMISEENIKFLLSTKELIYRIEQYESEKYIELHNDDTIFSFKMFDGKIPNVDECFINDEKEKICLLLDTEEMIKANKYMKTINNDSNKFTCFDGYKLIGAKENCVYVGSKIASGKFNELIMYYDLSLMETILSTITTSNFSLNFSITSIQEQNPKLANNVSCPIVIREKHDNAFIEDCKEFILLPVNTAK